MEGNTYYFQMPVKALRNLQGKIEFQSYFNTESLSVVDVGCNLPVNLMALYHDFNFSTLIGIDTQSQPNIMSDWFSRHPLDKNPSVKYGRTFYEFYHNNFDPNKADILTRKIFLSEAEFKAKIQFISNMPANYYFKSLESNIKFDYIILENILHLLTYEEQIELLEAINTHISENGLIYIYVNHKENQVVDQNPLSEEDLSNLLQGKFKQVERKIYWDEKFIKKKGILYIGTSLINSLI